MLPTPRRPTPCFVYYLHAQHHTSTSIIILIAPKHGKNQSRVERLIFPTRLAARSQGWVGGVCSVHYRVNFSIHGRLNTPFSVPLSVSAPRTLCPVDYFLFMCARVWVNFLE